MKAIRLHLKQDVANYRREETISCRMTYPLPPYSTVIGALHDACGYKEYHPMSLSIQGRYGSSGIKMFREECFLNSVCDDRGILVKMCSPTNISSAYTVVASALKSQGNSFEKGITIDVSDIELLDEYRQLKKLKKRISDVKKRVKEHKNKTKVMEKNKVSKDKIKSYKLFIKRLEDMVSKIEKEKYDKVYSCYRTLTRIPNRYELLFGVELIIHIVSDDDTMNDIIRHIDEFTAIGRSEDLVEVISAEFTELEETYDGQEINLKKFRNKFMQAYIPMNIIEEENKNFRLKENFSGIAKNGTKYLLNKNYTIVNKKRLFEKVAVLYADYRLKKSVDDIVDGVFFDKYMKDVYPVFLA